MRMHIDFDFKFHPVGFGLFTSGKIGNFRFVYDCGSTKTQRAVDSVNDEFKEHDHLGLLSISHFHKDHISGLNQLLTLVDKVDTIVLPYFTPRDRLVYILEYYKNQTQNEEDSWIVRFIQDPVRYLLEFFKDKIGRIVLIKGNSDISSESNDNNSDNAKEFVYEIDFSKLERVQNEDEIKEIEGISDEKVSIRKSGKVCLYNRIKIWQFIFYYPDPSPVAVKYFDKILKNAGIKEIISINDLLKVLDKRSLSNAAKDSKINNKEINNTSLILYHSPIGSAHSNLIQANIMSNIGLYCLLHKHKDNYSHFGFIYTGDIDLKSRHIEISNYYNGLLDIVCVYQVPHHGSIDNWHPSISNRNPRALHIISSSLTNKKLLHPNPKVLHSIAVNKGWVNWCNELNPFECNGRLYSY